MNLNKYDLVIVNSSGGKDSLCALWETIRLADQQSYPRHKIVVSHQDLSNMEWADTKDLVAEQSDLFGVKTYYSKRRDKNGQEETLLEYVSRRRMWPSSEARYCTSDFKRGPGARVVTSLTKEMGSCAILHVFGFRKQESPSRSKKMQLAINNRLTTKKRLVHDWLPIHDWTTKDVWDTIKQNNLPYHNAYKLGMPRLSCVFCIFSPFDALVVAGIANPDLLDEYVEVERKIGHTFKSGESIESVRDAINNGYKPASIDDWVM